MKQMQLKQMRESKKEKEQGVMSEKKTSQDIFSDKIVTSLRRKLEKTIWY